jgi:hypothetical protein
VNLQRAKGAEPAEGVMWALPGACAVNVPTLLGQDPLLHSQAHPSTLVENPVVLEVRSILFT